MYVGISNAMKLTKRGGNRLCLVLSLHMSYKKPGLLSTYISGFNVSSVRMLDSKNFMTFLSTRLSLFTLKEWSFKFILLNLFWVKCSFFYVVQSVNNSPNNFFRIFEWSYLWSYLSRFCEASNSLLERFQRTLSL